MYGLGFQGGSSYVRSCQIKAMVPVLGPLVLPLMPQVSTKKGP